ncbi:hypothetical protein VTI28DRAFT_2869 [Corynascus sepedonium]
MIDLDPRDSAGQPGAARFLPGTVLLYRYILEVRGETGVQASCKWKLPYGHLADRHAGLPRCTGAGIVLDLRQTVVSMLGMRRMLLASSTFTPPWPQTPNTQSEFLDSGGSSRLWTAGLGLMLLAPLQVRSSTTLSSGVRPEARGAATRRL